LNPTVVKVHEMLQARGETVVTAESLTAGLVGAALTEVAGSSASYRGGVVVYATDLKQQLLGVPAALLAERGAVDLDVAGAMAVGVRRELGADWGLALTGVAGPEPQDGRPVGVVFVAVAGPDDRVTASELFLTGDRPAIRAAARDAGIRVLCDRLAAGE
jgi:nicotinamide-nucleotide amidase